MKTNLRRLAAALTIGLLIYGGGIAVAEADSPAPEFAGVDQWLNSPPLKMSDLKGKVVLVDFWTYSCINCIRTLPYVEKWYETYKDKGLVVIGVHTPEFAFEKDTGNVQTAIRRFGLTYPVAQDNERATWNAYHNQYWPAEYLIDRDGNIVHSHFGEGEYDQTEKEIQKLLAVSAPVTADGGADLSDIRSPEMYFGLDRQEYQDRDQSPEAGTKTYSVSGEPKMNRYALDGVWALTGDHAELKSAGGITLRFNAAKVHIVASADKPVTLQVTVDGAPQPPVTVQGSQLYTLYDGKPGRHLLQVKAPAGLQAYTFTFG